ncbi:porin family protein [Arundinibacter roseus]|uniref:PorT family protein n=1 Tax=Arundinibacter roseus TaxID=2070510 RepID=A0A4R4KA10_9BACT|nr:porin family protein [Arundinibacter roseus]TDB64580.1 PorT family protein [Arundinibacter roseus]
MKKYFLGMALLSASFFAQAQENVSIGPIVGVTFANLRGDIVNNDWKAGPTLGGFYNYSSENRFGFSGQVLYTQLGAQVSNKTNEINLHYVQVPLLLTYFLGQGGIRPKLFIGPTANFLAAARDKDGENINGPSSNRVYRTVDIGVTAGIGLNYRIQNKVWLNADVRYGAGLIDISRNSSNTLHNHNVGINLGVSFPFGTYNSRSGTLNPR